MCMRVGGERGCCLKVVGGTTGRADPRQMLQSGLSVVGLLAGGWWVGGPPTRGCIGEKCDEKS